MLIPSRRVDEWTSVDGTATTYADPVVHLSTRREHEAAESDLFVAYPVSPLPNCRCIRIDFHSVIRNSYSSELLSGQDGGHARLEVVDRSEYLDAVLGEIEISNYYSGGQSLGAPRDLFRNFRITFGSYGRLDIAARSAQVRVFENDHDGFGSQFARHNSVLQDALLLGPIEAED